MSSAEPELLAQTVALRPSQIQSSQVKLADLATITPLQRENTCQLFYTLGIGIVWCSGECWTPIPLILSESFIFLAGADMAFLPPL